MKEKDKREKEKKGMNDIWRKILLGLDEISCWNYLQVERNLLNNEVFMERYLKLKYPDFLINLEEKEQKDRLKENKEEQKYKISYLKMIRTIKKVFIPNKWEYKEGNFYNQAIILKLFMESRDYDDRDNSFDNIIKLEEISMLKLPCFGSRIQEGIARACELGKPKILKYFLTKISLQLQNKSICPQWVKLACKSGNIECVKLLLQYGGKVSVEDLDFNVDSDLRRDVEMVKYLIEEVGIDASKINIKYNAYKYMPYKIIFYLLSKGVKVDNDVIQNLIDKDRLSFDLSLMF